MPIAVARLLELIPSDTRDRVDSSRKRANQPVRDAIRRHVALRLKRLPGRGVPGRAERVVRIHLGPGLPASLEVKSLDDHVWLAVLLSLVSGDLEGLRDKARSVLSIMPSVLEEPDGPELVAGREHNLHPSLSLAEDLLREADKFDLVRWMYQQDVHADVLGTYHLPGKDLFAAEGDARIELYWGIIGLVAPILGVRVEDLTVVVLAHELAHAYTHLGADIDGYRWATGDFAASDRYVQEGLAQYYTALVCQDLRSDDPRPWNAYAALLAKQPDPYHAHEPWLADFRPEEVRRSMLESRRQGAVTKEEFDERLANAKSALR